MVWQEMQSPAEARLECEKFQVEVLWHCEHWPSKWLAGLSLV